MINFPIVSKDVLAPGVKKIVVSAPLLAARSRPGQFVILRLCPEGERIPLSLADFDPSAGTVTLVFREVGKTTRLLGPLEPGEVIRDLVGPLGRPAAVARFGRVLCVGGAVGIAPLFPIARALTAAGNEVAAVLAARSSRHLIFREEMEQLCAPVVLATDDGSLGLRGDAAAGVEFFFSRFGSCDYCVCIGPPAMMEQVCNLTRPLGIKTVVSLNPLMVDGTGMCGACRVVVDGKVFFACVDGPEFDGHGVDWEVLKKRLQMYAAEEQRLLAASLREGLR